MKRFLDIVLSSLGVVALLPVFAIVAIAITLNSPGPVLFRQQRIGRRFRPFTIYKFRTMRVDAAATGRPISVGDDDRVTRVGRVLRRFKIDEFPQLFNVLKGDMSLVGPRPELKQFVEMYRDAYIEILEARPGLTDPASIKYRNEAALLGGCEDPEAEYAQRILPDKIRLSQEYVRRSSVSGDLTLLLKTVLHIANNEAL